VDAITTLKTRFIILKGENTLNKIQIISKGIGEFLLRNSPSILTGLGVGGVITTAIMAARATPKALALVFEEKEHRRINSLCNDRDIGPEAMTNFDIIKAGWKCYIPTALMGTATVACIISANSINLKRNAALAGLYSLAETSLREYQSKVIETIGNNKEEKMRDEIVQDRLNKDPVTGKEIIITKKGNTLCYDSLSGRYFRSDIEDIRRIQNDFNHQLINEFYLTLNEFYDELGLDHTDLGDNMGWTTDYSLLNITFSAKIASDGEPCIVLNYVVGPKKL
jgi:hypothetical protein